LNKKGEKVGKGEKPRLNFYQTELEEYHDINEIEKSSESDKIDQLPDRPPPAFVINGSEFSNIELRRIILMSEKESLFNFFHFMISFTCHSL
jgi:hypothetical protein